MSSASPDEDPPGQKWMYTTDHGWVMIHSLTASPDVMKVLRSRDWTEMTIPAFLLLSPANRAADAAERAKAVYGQTLQRLKAGYVDWLKRQEAERSRSLFVRKASARDDGTFPDLLAASEPRGAQGARTSEVDVRDHVQGVVELLQDLADKSLAYQGDAYSELSPAVRRLVYVLANHFAKLAKRVGSEIGTAEVIQVRQVLARFGIHNWSPEERVAWCRHCGHDPLYTRTEKECDYCGWMICPACDACYWGKGCKSRKGNESSKGLEGESQPSDIPF